MNAPYVYVQPRAPVTKTSISTAQTFDVSCDGFDTLILDVDYTYAAGTAMVFTFTGKSINTTNDYGLTVTNYTSGTISNASFTYSTGGASFSKRFIFSLTGIGITTSKDGNITVGIAVTNGTTDAATITPFVARTA